MQRLLVVFYLLLALIVMALPAWRCVHANTASSTSTASLGEDSSDDRLNERFEPAFALPLSVQPIVPQTVWRVIAVLGPSLLSSCRHCWQSLRISRAPPILVA